MGFDLQVEIMLLKAYHDLNASRFLSTPPLLVCFVGGKRILAIQARDMVDEADKHEVFKEMASTIPVCEAESFLFACDAWMSNIRKDEVPHDEDGNPVFDNVAPPSKRINRVESLVVIHGNRGEGEVHSRSMPYVRYEDTLYWVHTEDDRESHAAQGELAELFVRAFEIDEKPFTMAEHAAMMRDLGHDYVRLPAMADPVKAVLTRT